MKRRVRTGEPNNTKWSPHIDRMVSMANKGASYTEIGKAFDVPASTIRNALSRRGKYVTRKDVAQPKWQPIETAPRDGTLVLVCNTLDNGTITSINGKIAVARYAYHLDGLDESMWEYGTYYSENSKGNQGSYLISATHWMPLPKPPKE